MVAWGLDMCTALTQISMFHVLYDMNGPFNE